MGSLSIPTRNEVIGLSLRGFSVVQIRNELAHRDISMTGMAIFKLLNKGNTLKEIADLKRSQPTYGDGVTMEMLEIMDKAME